MSKKNLFLIVVGMIFINGVYAVVDLNGNDNQYKISDESSINSRIENVYDYENGVVSSVNGLNEKLNYKGYLVEYDNPPILKKKAELEKKAEKNLNSFWYKVYLGRPFMLKPSKVSNEVEKYKEEVINENGEIKNRILNELELSQKSKTPSSKVLILLKELQLLHRIENLWPLSVEYFIFW